MPPSEDESHLVHAGATAGLGYSQPRRRYHARPTYSWATSCENSSACWVGIHRLTGDSKATGFSAIAGTASSPARLNVASARRMCVSEVTTMQDVIPCA